MIIAQVIKIRLEEKKNRTEVDLIIDIQAEISAFRGRDACVHTCMHTASAVHSLAKLQRADGACAALVSEK